MVSFFPIPLKVVWLVLFFGFREVCVCVGEGVYIKSFQLDLQCFIDTYS